jgi:hypothetical protein
MAHQQRCKPFVGLRCGVWGLLRGICRLPLTTAMDELLALFVRVFVGVFFGALFGVLVLVGVFS